MELSDMFCPWSSRLCVILLAAGVIGSLAIQAEAQQVGATTTVGGGTTGTQSTSGTGGNQTVGGGIEIDAQGVLRARLFQDPSGQLTKKRMAAARAVLSQDVMKSSEFRKVSLNRLERELQKAIQSGQPVTNEMLYVAGLTRITHVFYLPESNDVVIAGPAEGFYSDVTGKVRGLETGRSTLELQDLIVALRAFKPGGQATSLIGVSIDPTPEGLQRLRQAVQSAQANFRQGMELEVVRTFRDALGMQTVTIKGVSTKTHFAQVLTEADYRMKLIGIGLETPQTGITSFIAKADPRRAGKNALQRWFFEPNYNCIEMSPDQNAMRLVGSGVKLVSEEERIDASGQRAQTGNTNRASREFCESFTEKFDELADEMAVFGEMRNLIDMTLVAAFMQHVDLYAKANWHMSYFADENSVPVETSVGLTQVEPAINAVWKNGVFMTPIGGGIAIYPRLALAEGQVKVDESGEISQARDTIRVDQLGDDQWWWD
jgi:hypothetical protein